MNENREDPLPKSTDEPGARKGWRSAFTVFSVVVLLSLSVFAACVERKVPGETVDGLREKSLTLRDKVRLRIGVRETLPYLSYRDPRTGVRSGFEIEIAKAVALDLGFTEDRIDWVTVDTVQSRTHAIQANLADIVVASLTMTPDRPVEFAGPYLLVPQAVLVHKKRTKPLENLTDLAAPGVRLCTGTGSTSAKALNDKHIKIELVNNGSQCIEGMTAGIYDAYSTDLPILASVVATYPGLFEILDVIVADTEERIGIAVPKGDTALRSLIAYILNSWLRRPDTGPWLLAYERTIGPYLDLKYRSQPLVENPPDLVDHDSKVRSK